MSDDPILVTGAAGFIGSHLCESLLDAGLRVVGVDCLDDYYAPALKIGNLAALTARPNFELRVVDLAEPRCRQQLADLRPTSVVHLAGVAGVRLSVRDPARYVRANLVATQNLLDAFPEVPWAFASSSSVYGNSTPAPFSESAPCLEPPSPYAATKRGAELLCEVAHRMRRTPITILRFFTVYGPRQRPDLAIRKFATAMLRDQPLTLFGDGSMARDFTHVKDIVRGIRAAMGELSGLRTINLGNSSPVTVRQLIDALERALGRRAIVQSVERPPGEMDVTYADVSAAHARWGWRPEIPLAEGLADFAQWLVREEAAGRNIG